MQKFKLSGGGLPTKVSEGGVKKVCPFYATWVRMMERCYSERVHKDHPTYANCLVCDQWLTFANFKSWMEKQDWQGKQLDKDILVPGNKTYSPETCVFVSREVNMFMIDRENSERILPQGVRIKYGSRYHAQVKWKGRTVHIGSFKTPEEASFAYKEYKKQLAKILAEEQSDHRVKDAILNKFNDEQILK